MPGNATLGQEFESFHAPPDPDEAAAPVSPEPSGELTLRTAIAASLLGNPELAMFSWEIRRRDARSIQSGLLPNPDILIEIENFAGSGNRESFEQMETTVWFSQSIQIGGKRSKREKVANLDRTLSAWQYEQARLDILTRTHRAFIQTLSAQARLQLAKEMERLARDAIRSRRASVKAGAAAPVESIRADVELSRRQLQREAVQRELNVSRAALAGMWGSATPLFTEARGDLSLMPAVPPLEELNRRIGTNPDVALWHTVIAQREAALSLERARGIPDPTFDLGGRYFNDNGDAALVFGVSVPLPVFDRNQGGVLDAASGLAQAKAEKAVATLAVQTTLRQRHAGLAASHRAAETLGNSALPSAEEAYRGARDGFEKGLFPYHEVLDAQRLLFELRMERVALLTEFHLARADLERLTASPLESPLPSGDER